MKTMIRILFASVGFFLFDHFLLIFLYTYISYLLVFFYSPVSAAFDAPQREPVSSRRNDETASERPPGNQDERENGTGSLPSCLGTRCVMAYAFLRFTAPHLFRFLWALASCRASVLVFHECLVRRKFASLSLPLPGPTDGRTA